MVGNLLRLASLSVQSLRFMHVVQSLRFMHVDSLIKCSSLYTAEARTCHRICGRPFGVISGVFFGKYEGAVLNVHAQVLCENVFLFLIVFIVV